MFGTRLIEYRGSIIILDPWYSDCRNILGVTVYRKGRVVVCAGLNKDWYKTPWQMLQRIKRLL